MGSVPSLAGYTRIPRVPGSYLALASGSGGSGDWREEVGVVEVPQRESERSVGAGRTQWTEGSLACMLFELAVGEFLFEPRKGSNYGKNDDHVA